MFGDFTAVDHITMQIEEGSVYGFLGPNGSGKSTTIRMLCGLLAPTSGEGLVLGMNLSSEGQKLKHQVGYMSQKFSLYPELTVMENLEFYSGLYGLKGAEKKKRIDQMLALADLEGREDERAGILSGGWRQRLALGCAILHKPKMLFLDEPTAGLDPESAGEIDSLIRKLRDLFGLTIVLITHDLDLLWQVADRVAVLGEGKVQGIGSMTALAKMDLPAIRPFFDGPRGRAAEQRSEGT